MIRKKDFGLLIALGVLAFMAVFSPKKVLVAEGFAVTPEELEDGGRIYERFCASCHQEGRNGAPQTGSILAWKEPIRQGMQQLITHAFEGFRGVRGVMPPKGGHPLLTAREVTLATGWMVQQSSPRGGQ